jgi:TonB family protein
MKVGIAWLFAVPVILPSVQAAQKSTTQQPPIIRKTNEALRASAINRVEPLYPPSALLARIAGTVLVEVAIDEGGYVTSARALSGHPLLKDAAMSAARAWTFTPTIQKEKPVKVLGSLTFSFNLPEYVLRDRLIERLKQQIAKNPQNPKLHYQLGRAYEDNEQYGDALKAYARAAALNPHYGDAELALGSLNMKLNQYDEALRAYNRAARLDLPPERRAAANRGMALIYFRRERYQEAVEPFKQAIALAPQNPMYLNLGLTYLKLGDKTSAMEQYLLLKERNSILAQQLLNRINDAQ